MALANEGYQIVRLGFLFDDKATIATVTMRMHNTGKMVYKYKCFPTDMSASEIIRMHMDYPDEWQSHRESEPSRSDDNS